MCKVLIRLKPLHQKHDLSYKKDNSNDSSGGLLSDRMPPDKLIKKSLFATQDAELKALNNTNEEGEVMCFDYDSTNLFIDYCVTGVLTEFRGDFID